MTRILLRAAKHPFEAFSVETTLERNTIATNVGNLLFSHAVYRMLSTEGTTIQPNRMRAVPEDSDRINEEYDVFVVPLANAFRLDFERHLTRLTQLIERLTIPVVVFGVGAQTGLDYDVSQMRPIDDTVTAFCRAVLDRSPSIGVRGELTETYLNQLGFRDVDVIGCPSMFLHGRHLQVEKKKPTLEADAQLTMNVSPKAYQMEEFATRTLRRHPNLTYIVQNHIELEMLLWGDGDDGFRNSANLPIGTSHPLYREDKVRFFADPWTWIDHLCGVDFSFGTRIHGNVAALLAGTPGYVLAHDSRTLELARYHEIPHRRLTELSQDVEAADLYAEADYGPTVSGHAARFATLVEFMDKHRLDHIFAPGRSNSAFDDELRTCEFPPAAHALQGPDAQELHNRLRWLRSENADRKRDNAERKRDNASRRREIAELKRRNAELRQQVGELRRRGTELDRLARRTAALEREVARLRRSPLRRLRRLAGRTLRAARRRS